jgi:hypothetical protein
MMGDFGAVMLATVLASLAWVAGVIFGYVLGERAGVEDADVAAEIAGHLARTGERAKHAEELREMNERLRRELGER